MATFRDVFSGIRKATGILGTQQAKVNKSLGLSPTASIADTKAAATQRKQTTALQNAITGAGPGPQGATQALYKRNMEDPYGYRGQETEARKAFSEMRVANRASLDTAKEQALRDLTQREAAAGGFGGAGLKLREQTLADIEKRFAQSGAEIGAKESEAITGIKAQETAQQFAEKEAEAGRGLSREQLAQQAQQFSDTLKFQTNSFLEQLKFNYAEFSENQKTNFVNAWVAMKDAGLVKSNVPGQNVSGLYPQFVRPGAEIPSVNGQGGGGRFPVITTPRSTGTTSGSKVIASKVLPYTLRRA